MTPLLLSHFTATSCLGHGLTATFEALAAARGGLAPCRFESVVLDTYIGEVAGVDAVRLPAELQTYNCRNNRLAQLGLEQDGFIDAVHASAARWG
jgi:3-oxoacyl-[acyl-carrier-protein] synthase I